jgi:hypothetical protein
MNQDAAPTTDWNSVRRIFLRWEWLRIAYNAALAAAVIGLVASQYDEDTDWQELVRVCVVGAVVANVCYFAGPVAEAYLHWLGVRIRGITVMLFSMGLVFALGLATVAVLSTLGSL